MTKNPNYNYGYRALAARIILDAFKDCDRRTDYKSQYATLVAQDAKNSAVRFFKSSWFIELADGVNVSSENIKKEAFK